MGIQGVEGSENHGTRGDATPRLWEREETMNVDATMLGQALGTAALQFGALGLCAFMVMQNYRAQRAMAAELDRRNQRMEDLVAHNTESMNRLAQALGDRPCLREDSRIRHASGGPPP